MILLPIAAHICFIAGFIFYARQFFLNCGMLIYPVYLAPAVIYALLAISTAGINRFTREGFFKIFGKVSIVLFVFLVLFLAPELIKFNFPDPHNFILRKFEILLGASYACFTTILMGYILYRLNKTVNLSNVKNKDIFVFIFTFIFIFSFAVSMWFNYANQPTGDEPVYLLAAHSMIYDRDIDLKNNYEKKDYLHFYDKELEPQGIESNGKLYSYHPVLISILISPFYFIGGRFGVSAFVNFLSAILSALLFLFLAGFYEDKKISIAASLITAFSLPVFMFANQICCEVLSGVLILGSFVLFTQYRKKFYIACGLLALVPWAHPRNLIIWAILLIIIAYEHRKEIEKVMALIASQAVSLLLLFWFNYGHYHALIPRQTQANMTFSQVFKFNLQGIIGLFFDQEFGLYFYTPIFILMFAGAISLFKSNKKAFWQAALIFVPYYAMIASWADWRGGGGASPRFFVPVVFVFSLLIAEVLNNLRHKFSIMLVRCLTALGFFISMCIFLIPWFRWNKGLGENWILKFASRFLKIHFSSFFPSLWAPGKNTVFLTVFWIIIAAGLNWFYLINNGLKSSDKSPNNGK